MSYVWGPMVVEYIGLDRSGGNEHCNKHKTMRDLQHLYSLALSTILNARLPQRVPSDNEFSDLTGAVYFCETNI